MSDDEEPPCLQPISEHTLEEHPNQEGPPSAAAIRREELEKVENKNPVPVLLLTGYLGSGKTTLVNYILTAKHGYRCAVLLNEIGDTADIEKALVKEPEVGRTF